MGYFRKEFLENTAEAVNKIYNHPVSIKEYHLEFEDFYDSGRRQYNGDKLLKAVDALPFPEALKVVGLCNVDLFIPILTYIMGQAQLGGRSGIVSMHRLHNEQYGLKPNEKLLLERFNKVVIHELGHTFGFIHCYNPSCVMRSSTYVEDIDQKDPHLCPTCSAMTGLR